MKDTGYVRITEIVLENFKNIRYGRLVLPNRSESSTVSMLGIYGQNGSGKTAVIDALGVLSRILQGRSLPNDCGNYINVDSDHAGLQFNFKVTSDDCTYNVIYSFKLALRQPDENEETEPSDNKAAIYDEQLRCSYSDSRTNLRMAYVINTDGFRIFGPEQKYRLFTSGDKNKEIALLMEKFLSYRESRSFIFSARTQELLNRETDRTDEYCIYRNLLNRLSSFGKRELFIVETRCSNLISFDTLPFLLKDDSRQISGRLDIPINASNDVSAKSMAVIEHLIGSINIVLTELVPGLSLEIKYHDRYTNDKNEETNRYELMAIRDGLRIPLRYESEGIKKIISILQLLIVAYNTPAVTIAIDELDSGIYEYLLGELLRIMSEEAEGQIIFTSHNLRPLETIDKKFIAFSTANPDNRYIRMENVMENNNLRNMYFRDIQMNNQKELMYQPTSNTRITEAFINAGWLKDKTIPS